MASLIFRYARYVGRHPKLYSRTFIRTLSSKQSTIPFLLTDIGEGISEVEIVRFHVKEGDPVIQFQPIVEVQSDKATVEISSRYDGIIESLGYEPGDIAPVGSPLCHIRTDPQVEDNTQPKREKQNENQSSESDEKLVMGKVSELDDSSTVKATPATRAFARRSNVDIAHVTGSGPDGRVTKEDVIKFLAKQNIGKVGSSENEIPFTSEEHAVVSDYVQNDTRCEPIRGLRRGMYKSMTSSLEIPQMSLYDEINMEQAIKLKNRLQELIDSEQITTKVKFTYLPIFVKATSLALRRVPILNARVNTETESIEYHDNHNISVAISTPEGLTVPTIRKVEQLSVIEIALELERLAGLAQNSQLAIQDLSDGTFSLSNIGPLGAKLASPVVFPPQVGIGAIGKIEQRPVVDEQGKISVKSMMYVTWAADHRIIDGATLARFNSIWKKMLENPGEMVAEMK